MCVCVLLLLLLLLQLTLLNAIQCVQQRDATRDEAFDPEEDELVLERSWPHLGLVYEIFVTITLLYASCIW